LDSLSRVYSRLEKLEKLEKGCFLQVRLEKLEKNKLKIKIIY